MFSTTQKTPLPLDTRPSTTSTSGSRPTSPRMASLSEQEDAHLAPPGSNAFDFDPCRNAHPLSPFYDHDSPRVSSDQRSRSYFSKNDCPKTPNETFSKPTVPVVHVNDLEAQYELTPSVSLEKHPSRDGARGIRMWPSRASGMILTKVSSNGAMTKPKPKNFQCLAGLTKKQKLIVKLLFAMVILGAMIGIAVGVTIRVHGGVWKNNNDTSGQIS